MSPALPWLAPALLALTVLAGPAAALESAPVASERARMTLAAEVQSVAPGQPFRVGLRQSLAPGWHTYWKNPGDAGTPPELSFTLPEGASATGFDWPAPYRMPFGPLVNYGYEGQVLLPLTVTPPADLRPGDVFTIEAEGSWLVCEKVCIPEEGVFRLDLPVEPTARPDPALADAFRAAEASLPRPPLAGQPGLRGAGGRAAAGQPRFRPRRGARGAVLPRRMGRAGPCRRPAHAGRRGRAAPRPAARRRAPCPPAPSRACWC
ncbi:protein-disulfide reductase DsbD domain-containing protein [Pseudoroseomonas cervicalis]|uniref:protein-disulfide reductase DsbD domain-containing protein n=1 Tax=Teichococcus cervicalis TaxID=204525 RepID=UPI0035E9D0FD